jgi:hypothetical protein
MTNNNRWLLAVVVVDCVAAAMAIIGRSNSIVDGGGGGIELMAPMAPMAASLTATAVDGSGDNGVLTNASQQ